jgi:hypothetical protein
VDLSDSDSRLLVLQLVAQRCLTTFQMWQQLAQPFVLFASLAAGFADTVLQLQ